MTTDRSVAFLTAPPEMAAAALRVVRERWPETAWVVYHRASDRAALGDALDGVEARSDKPAGGKLEFIRGLRAARYDRAVVLWCGHRQYDRPKLLALLAGARSAVAWVPGGEFVALDRIGWKLLAHARWRPSLGGDGRGSFFASVLRAGYKHSLGRVVASVRLLAGARRALRDLPD